MADSLACSDPTPHGFHGWRELAPVRYHVCPGVIAAHPFQRVNVGGEIPICNVCGHDEATHPSVAVVREEGIDKAAGSLPERVREVLDGFPTLARVRDVDGIAKMIADSLDENDIYGDYVDLEDLTDAILDGHFNLVAVAASLSAWLQGEEPDTPDRTTPA